MLEATGLGYRAGARWLLRDVSLSVEPGQFWVIVGANGAGKSTLLRVLSGELTPHTGDLRLLRQAAHRLRTTGIGAAPRVPGSGTRRPISLSCVRCRHDGAFAVEGIVV